MENTMKRRTSSTIPFGYKLDEENPQYVTPVEEELKALDKIIPMLKTNSISLREGAAWLQYTTGRHISHQGLNKIAKRYE